jgi:hypothetical protein
MARGVQGLLEAARERKGGMERGVQGLLVALPEVGVSGDEMMKQTRA